MPRENLNLVANQPLAVLWMVRGLFFSLRDGGLPMNTNTTEVRIDSKLYLVTAVCSQAATETIEKKLERLICRHASDTKSYQIIRDTPLAMCEKVREHGAATIIKE